ncbi:inverse autotransporter beta domain-containing protein [Maioricimonas sp. JC845]|uniref:inverse autotransporter beta domain-containing protein n=1 Tax=Maioricimonas sp. JC845 TaxID=3232138 RepID=UPI00345ACDBD
MLLGCLLASSLLAGRSVCAQVGFGHSYSASAGTTPAAKTVTRAQSPERPSPFYPDAGQVFTPGVSPWVTTPTASQGVPQMAQGTFGGGGMMGDPFLNPGAPVAGGFPSGFGQPGYWNPYIAGTFDGGTERVLGRAQLMVPLFQNGYELVFADIRGQYDDRDNSEANFGLAKRVMGGPDWIYGGYIFYDRKHTAYNNDFSQVSLGIEMMSIRWEARANGYIPLSGSKAAPGATTFDVVGGNLVMQAGRERAYYGFDGEVGMLLTEWYGGMSELRGFVGGFHFDTDASGFTNVTGPKGRLEMRSFDLPMFGADSRLTLGVEVKWDDVRDTQVSGFARLMVPLGPAPTTRNGRLRRRMYDRIIRDDDIITVAAGAGPQEQAVDLLTGRPLINITTVDGTTANVPATIAGAGANSTIFVDGSAGTVSVADRISLQNNQLVFGGNSQVQVQGAVTGSQARYIVPGSRPTIEGTDPNDDVIRLVDNTSVRGIDVVGGRNGFIGDNTGGGLPDPLANVQVIDTSATMANFDGSDESGNGYLFDDLDAASVISENIAFANGNNGFVFGDSSARITDNISRDNPGAGFLFGSGDPGGANLTGDNNGLFQGNVSMDNQVVGFGFDVNNGTFSNNADEGSGYGVFANSNAGIFSGNSSTDSQNDGFRFTGDNTGSFVNNTATGAVFDGFDFDDNTGTFTGNVAMDNLDNGFEFDDNFGLFSENSATGNQNDGFQFDDNFGTMTRNTASRNLGDGFQFDVNAAGGIFNDNRSTQNDFFGFRLNAQNGTATGNTASGNGTNNDVP